MGSNPVQKVNWQSKVNLQLLKYLQLPLRRSNLHLNFNFRSPHHLSKEDLYGSRCNFTLVALFYFALNNMNKCAYVFRICSKISSHHHLAKLFQADFCFKLKTFYYISFIKMVNVFSYKLALLQSLLLLHL